ncbi:MAG: GNAT family protein [Dehalococcoidales bacterium]|jgi:RimJ/RimL family protein N-acetyltransferase
MSNEMLDRNRVKLTDGKITLRPYRKEDSRDSFQAIKESLKEISVWLPFAHEDYTRKENLAWVKKRPADWKKGTAYEFAIFGAADGMMIGGCGLNAIDHMNRRANLGYWVRTSHTGNGVAVAATVLLAKWGFAALKLTRIEILVAVDNQRSLRVAEKAGAKREGVLRNRIVIRDRAYDAVMHSLVPGDI